jgi:hypothetical protein
MLLFCASTREVESDRRPDQNRAGSERIDIHQDYEVEYWTKELGVSKERLKQLVTRARRAG